MDNILNYLRILNAGYNTNAAFMDVLNLDCSEAAEIIENLISKGLVKRLGRRYIGFVSYSLTENGKKMIEKEYPDISKLPLPEDQWKVLTAMKKTSRPMLVKEIEDATGLDNSRVSNCLTFLSEHGYSRDQGLFLRKASITEQGLKILQQR